MLDDLLSPMHVIILLLVALLIFGPKRLPEIGSGLGKAIRDFKNTINGISQPTDVSTPSTPVSSTLVDSTTADSRQTVGPPNMP